MDWGKIGSLIAKNSREMMTDPISPTGNISWGRVASTVSLLATVVWVSYLVFTTHHMPNLDGSTAYVIAPYTANKAATAVQSFSKGDK